MNGSAVRLTPNKDIRELIRLAEGQGWVIRGLANNHLRWYPPKGPFVHTSCSPHGQHAIKKIKHDLWKGGLRLTLDDYADPGPVTKNEENDVEKAKKIYGRGERALEILREDWPRPVTLEQLCLRVSGTCPGTESSHLMNGLKKYRLEGKIKKVGTGMYQAAGEWPGKPGEEPRVTSSPAQVVASEAPPVVEMPLDAKAVFDNFFSAWAEMEKLAQQVQRKIERLEELKRVLNNVEIK